MSLNTLNKIELRTRGVDLDEAVAIAHALGVPPVELILPVGHEAMTKVLPGVTLGTWAAAKWFSGQEPFPTQMPDDTWAVTDDDWARWEQSAVQSLTVQDVIFEAWNTARTALRAVEREAASVQDTARETRLLAEAELLHEDIEDCERRLRLHRQRMQESGLTPAPLTANLAHVDKASRG